MKFYFFMFYFLFHVTWGYYDIEHSEEGELYTIIPYHQVYPVEFASSVVIYLPEEILGIKLDANITLVPEFGMLHQVTQIYNTHGYEPIFDRSIQERRITKNETKVYSDKNIIVYALPEEHQYHLTPRDFARGNFKYYARFRYELQYNKASIQVHSYLLRDGGTNIERMKEQKAYGYVTLVNSEKIFLRSMFTFSNERWQVINNNICNGDKDFETYYVSDRRGEEFLQRFDVYEEDDYFGFDKEKYMHEGIIKAASYSEPINQACEDPKLGRISHDNSQLMNLTRFVYGSERERHFAGTGSEPEFARWYFKAPSKFSGDWTIMYGGTIEFIIGTLGGDFVDLNNYNSDLNIVVLECEYCSSNLKRLVYRIQPDKKFSLIKNLLEADFHSFDVVINLTETDRGWMTFPHNPIESSRQPTKCEFVSILSGVTGFSILGDYLKGYETVGIDDVTFRVGAVGPHSGPPHECYCVSPGIDCNANDFIYA